MNNRIDLVFGYHASQQVRIADITNDQLGSRGNGCFEPIGKVV
jgi:hypothetical protein